RQAPGHLNALNSLGSGSVFEIFGKLVDGCDMFGGVLQRGRWGRKIEMDLVEPRTIKVRLQNVLVMVPQSNTPMRVRRVFVIDRCLRGDAQPEIGLDVLCLLDK